MAGICSDPFCETEAAGRGLCHKHYQRVRNAEIRAGIQPRRKQGAPKPVCKMADCDRTSKSLGMCNLHYQRYKKHGNANVSMKAGKRAMYTIPTPVIPYTRVVFPIGDPYGTTVGAAVDTARLQLDLRLARMKKRVAEGAKPRWGIGYLVPPNNAQWSVVAEVVTETIPAREYRKPSY